MQIIPSLVKDYKGQPHSSYGLAVVEYDIRGIFKDIKEKKNWMLISKSIDEIQKVFVEMKQLFKKETEEYTLMQKKGFLCREKIIQEKIHELNQLRSKILANQN
ncbi:MAG: hypothetical protein NTX91_03225 [candidate division SR1 bacterium]|nr:hypothetical protein [candidate division SR1 bacterium]